MHMHCHLIDVLKNSGPVHGFWLLLYEQYNDMLGNQPNNDKTVKSQLLKHFLCHNFVISLNPPESFNLELMSLLGKLNPRELAHLSFHSDGDSAGKYSLPKA